MVAGGTAPDIALFQIRWFQSGLVPVGWWDLSDYFHNGPEASNRMRQIYYKVQYKVVGANCSNEIVILYYNKQMFNQAGLAYPPARAEKA